jgi:hypothetical protein
MSTRVKGATALVMVTAHATLDAGSAHLSHWTRTAASDRCRYGGFSEGQSTRVEHRNGIL